MRALELQLVLNFKHYVRMVLTSVFLLALVFGISVQDGNCTSLPNLGIKTKTVDLFLSSFQNLGIQCVRRREVRDAIMQRMTRGINPFKGQRCPFTFTSLIFFVHFQYYGPACFHHQTHHAVKITNSLSRVCTVRHELSSDNEIWIAKKESLLFI